MSNSDAVVDELLRAIPQLRSQLFFKTSLTALSHAMEDQVLAGTTDQGAMDQPLVIASFQQARFYRQEASRYQRIAQLTDQVYVLSAAGTSFENSSSHYETIAFTPDDGLTQEWHLVVMGAHYSACLICRERAPAPLVERSPTGPALEQTRRFEGIWSPDRGVTQEAAALLLDRIESYRPELSAKLAIARDHYLKTRVVPNFAELSGPGTDPFTQRLVTYLQAGQYKLLKTYKAIANQERRARLVNSITAAIRRSLNPEEIFQIAVREVGQALGVCRCIVYRCYGAEEQVQIQYEHREPQVSSLQDQVWPLTDHPLLQRLRRDRETLAIADTQAADPDLAADLLPLVPLMEQWQIRSWLMVPLLYQQRLLGVIEIHHCQSGSYTWNDDDIALVESVAAQLSVAIIQADAYAHLQDLNQQLAALESTRSNLIAITGHELRTPLSTIQVCLESLEAEPDMPQELRSIMLTSALKDAERMRKLVQDFLTLSRLESGRIEWNLEALAIGECIDLALSSIQARHGQGETCPHLVVDLPRRLPLVWADGEWVVEVIVKLLDNACKFTDPSGTITLQAQQQDPRTLQVTVIDTGRGIEAHRLETVFDRFYQEEGALRRTAGGTGLGLAMCRQIVEGLKGQIWATSGGKDQGSQFHFTLPIAEGQASLPARRAPRKGRTTAAKNRDGQKPA
ncbi:DICT sensory domain-containing protein [Leptolyngbya sp. PCC 6406]|uniref:DICT sensory domain-containing protein n=1 Tax=Leptolyngbya sp. PCC 6406 TaxID=1173264 RepID=UPI0002ACCCCC|nr:DICT sensory domain-containing protein [Leptolyngbya sp. PCC 6406]